MSPPDCLSLSRGITIYKLIIAYDNITIIALCVPVKNGITTTTE